MAAYLAHIQNFSHRSELLMPEYYPDMSTEHLLCMSFIEGQPLDRATLSEQQRNQITDVLLRLFFAEFLKFRCVQTDPNPANFLYNAEREKLVLLDFGATRTFSEAFTEQYLKALRAAIFEDRAGLQESLEALGFFSDHLQAENIEVILNIFILGMEPMRYDGAYDFNGANLIQRIQEAGMSISTDPDAWHSPPPDVLFLHRKLAGVYMIAARLHGCANVKKIIEDYL